MTNERLTSERMTTRQVAAFIESDTFDDDFSSDFCSDLCPFAGGYNSCDNVDYCIIQKKRDEFLIFRAISRSR